MNALAVSLGGMMNREYIWNLSDLKNVARNNLKVFSCFSCGGGSCMGYKLAGFDVIGNNEIDAKINKMYIKNFNPKHNFRCDIREMVNKPIPEELYNLDILDGSPPCSAFSSAGLRDKVWNTKKKFREGQEKQKLDDLFIHFINFANRIKPKVIVAENVKGMMRGKSKGYVSEIIKKFNEIGYKVQIFLLNAASMGVPQRRERLFFIASKKDLNFPKLKLQFKEKPIKYGEFADNNYKPINKSTQSYKIWSLKNSTDTKFSDVLKRTEGRNSRFNAVFLHPDKVPQTITASGEFFRFDVPGIPSAKDYITIQTFPQDYDFCGQNVQYVCGMSVPPLMMKKIAEQIYLQFFKED